jgi:hypothetical protein
MLSKSQMRIYMIQKIKHYFRHSFPLVSRTRLDTLAEEQFQILKNREAAEARRGEMHAEEMETLRNLAEQYLPRVAQVVYTRERVFGTGNKLRLSITIDPYLIQQSFVWGNSNRELHYLSEMIAHSIAKELIGISSSRYIQDLDPYEVARDPSGHVYHFRRGFPDME